jgi:hypothetical protein
MSQEINFSMRLLSITYKLIAILKNFFDPQRDPMINANELVL